MACTNMRFENEAAAILNQPMSMSWSGGDRLTLSNARGKIVLARSY
jgi:heat shock protein HslJ